MRQPAVVPVPAHALLDRHFAGEWRGAKVFPVEGSTNFVARFELNGRTYALRVPRVPDAVTRVDRHSELAILNAAAQAQLAPEVIAHDAAAGVLLTRWIDGDAWSHGQARATSSVIAIAMTLRRLHALRSVPGARTIQLETLIADYLGALRGVSHTALAVCQALEDTALDRLASLPRTVPVLCHNDAHHRNILEAERIYLLDWEYAGLGEALFDLAAYAGYHDLDKGRTAVLLESYGAGARTMDDFAGWRWLFEYVWVLWLLVTTARCPTRETGGGVEGETARPPHDADLVDRLLSRLR